MEKALTTRQQGITTFEDVAHSVVELGKFYKDLMQKGTDYDVIPGTPKPTLLKSGAELLRLRFGLHPEFKVSKGLTDVQQGFIEYDVVCALNRDGEVIAEGVGNANSLESKWRYRWVWPNELPQNFDKQKAYETYGATRKTKQGGVQYRMENENPQDQANTILKIAKKRAFVDAILTATGASRIFTQDVEDMDIPKEEGEAEGEPEQQPASELGTCPDCGKALVERDGRYGKFIACSGFPQCRWRPPKKGKKDKEQAEGGNDTTEEPEPTPAQSEGEKLPFKEMLVPLMKALNWKGSDLLEYCKKNFNANLADLQDLVLLSQDQKQALIKDLNEMIDLKNAS
jgi:hypothetical protein